MSEEDLKIAKDQYLELLKSEDRDKIERETKGQSFSTEWKEQRRKRLTASFFGRICKKRPQTSSAKIIEQIRYQSFTGNANTKWGLDKEPLAIAQFSSERGVAIESSGLVIDKTLPFLAASPDGIVIDDRSIIEVKCPASAKTMTPMEGILQKKLNL